MGWGREALSAAGLLPQQGRGLQDSHPQGKVCTCLPEVVLDREGQAEWYTEWALLRVLGSYRG